MENRIVFKKKTAYYLEILRIYKNPYSCLLKNASFSIKTTND